uniref:Uncharacterized protein n=1 Tax=Rhizophora mucronata TaxID=61149 RepID=A0A2P2PA63_RHIMU
MSAEENGGEQEKNGSTQSSQTLSISSKRLLSQAFSDETRKTWYGGERSGRG